MINPYQPSNIHTAQSPAATRREPSLIWFAATTAGLLFGWFGYFELKNVDQIGGIQAVFEALRDAGPLLIPAVAIYALARHVFRLQFDYSSTVVSLVFAGVIAFGYLALLQHYYWYNRFDRQLLWWVGALIGLPMGFGLSALERIVARPRTTGTNQIKTANTLSGRRQTDHASIFWFSGAVGVGMAAAFFISEPDSASLSSANLSSLAEVSSVFCLMFTSAYGVLSACLVRRYPATITSRLSAAAVYVGLLWALNLIFSEPPSILFIPLLFFGPAVFAVLADRLVARHSG